MVDVKQVAIQVGDRELPQAPRLFFQRLHDVCAGRLQLLVRGIDSRREPPMNGRLERRSSLANEDRDVPARDSADRLVRVGPIHLETEHVAIVLLRTLDVDDRQLWDGCGEVRSSVHGLLVASGRAASYIRATESRPSTTNVNTP